jgi:hypothetical protein
VPSLRRAACAQAPGCVDQLLLVLQRFSSSPGVSLRAGASFSSWRAALGASMPMPPRADDPELGLQRLDRRRQSSSSAGVACWLIATRAQAVSSRLTALSGSWRAGM